MWTALALGLGLGGGVSARAATWTSLDPLLADTDCLRVAAGARLVVDGDLAVERLEILGSVTFEDAGPRSLTAAEVRVQGGGELLVGSEAAPFVNPADLRLVEGSGACAAELRLEPDDSLTPLTPGTVGGGFPRALHVMGGRLELHGTSPGVPWTTLARTAAAGDLTMAVPGATGWTGSPTVVLAPTGYDLETYDVRAARPVTLGPDEEVWDLGRPLDADHYVAGPRDTLPVAGEVAVLTRNVRVYDPSPTDVPQPRRDCTLGGGAGEHLQFDGAEILVEAGEVHLAHVEVFNAGKFDRMGSYPVHLHETGPTDATLVGNVVHTSSNRGVVLHATEGVQASDNVVFDVVGHAFYLEESPGMETRHNRLEGNLALAVHGCPPLAPEPPEDVDAEHDARASGFFFTDERNALVHNVAAGARAAGFWWDEDNQGPQDNLCGGEDLLLPGAPAEAPLDAALFAYPPGYDADYSGLDTTCRGAFVGNVAHTSDWGLWSEEHKDQVVRITDFLAYKNRIRGIELKNHGVTELPGLELGDNPSGLWTATHAFHVGFSPRVLVVDATVVGIEPERPPEDPPGGAAVPFLGIEIYEGRQHVARTHFAGFPEVPPPGAGVRAALGRHQTFPFYSNDPDNAVEQLTFAVGTRRLWFDAPTADTREVPPPVAPLAAASGFQSVALLDLDGSITRPGDWIVADDDFNIPGDAGAPGPGVSWYGEGNAWIVDPTVWGRGQLLVQWCARSVDRPRSEQGLERCDPLGPRSIALPQRQWEEVRFGPGYFDLVDRVVFTDLDDCGGPGPCGDALDADHVRPNGEHHRAAANVRSDTRYAVDFFDEAGTDLHRERAFDDVAAIQISVRASTDPVELVSVAVPSAPTCVCAYETRRMDRALPMTCVPSTPTAPDEWSYDADRVELVLPGPTEDSSVLLVFDPAAVCPC